MQGTWGSGRTGRDKNGDGDLVGFLGRRKPWGGGGGGLPGGEDLRTWGRSGKAGEECLLCQATVGGGSGKTACPGPRETFSERGRQ